jgi:hypothetical protein
MSLLPPCGCGGPGRRSLRRLAQGVFRSHTRHGAFRPKDGGQTFPQQTRVAEDGWEINGCPESGATISVDTKRILIAWMTAGKDAKARVQLASSDDGALHFQAPLSASQDIRDPNHPVFAESQSGKLLLSFQGRSASANGQWNPTAVFVTEILDDKLEYLSHSVTMQRLLPTQQRHSDQQQISMSRGVQPVSRNLRSLWYGVCAMNGCTVSRVFQECIADFLCPLLAGVAIEDMVAANLTTKGRWYAVLRQNPRRSYRLSVVGNRLPQLGYPLFPIFRVQLPRDHSK